MTSDFALRTNEQEVTEEREKKEKIEVHVSPWELGIMCMAFLIMPVVIFFHAIISFFIFFGKDPAMQGLSSFAGFLSTLIVLAGAYTGIKKYLKEKLK